MHGEVQPGQTFKKIYSQLKHAIRILPSKDRSTHTRELFKECKVLNVYQVNIWKNLVFMHQVNSNTVPTIFLNKFKKPTHNYPTNFARTNYSIPPFKLNKSKYRISIRGSTLWKNIPTDTEKKHQKTNIFKTVVTNKLLALENKLTYFQIEVHLILLLTRLGLGDRLLQVPSQ